LHGDEASNMTNHFTSGWNAQPLPDLVWRVRITESREVQAVRYHRGPLLGPRSEQGVGGRARDGDVMGRVTQNPLSHDVLIQASRQTLPERVRSRMTVGDPDRNSSVVGQPHDETAIPVHVAMDDVKGAVPSENARERPGIAQRVSRADTRMNSATSRENLAIERGLTVGVDEKVRLKLAGVEVP